MKTEKQIREVYALIMRLTDHAWLQIETIQATGRNLMPGDLSADDMMEEATTLESIEEILAWIIGEEHRWPTARYGEILGQSCDEIDSSPLTPSNN